jgi:acyl dehydratase
MTRSRTYFDSIEEGQPLPASAPIVVDPATAAAWATLTQDPNPLYVDEAHAKRVGFPSTCLPCTLMSGKVATWAEAWASPGGVKRVELAQRRILWPDEALHITGKVHAKRLEAGACYVDLRVEVRNAAGEVALEGEVTTWLHRNVEQEDRAARGLAGGDLFEDFGGE